MKKELKVCTAWSAFFGSFEKQFPNLQLLENPFEVENYDLVIFPGGEDISPSLYGARNKHCGAINGGRDEFERMTFKYAYDKTKIKILGICRGHQLINAILGGYVIQDIREEFGSGHKPWHDLKQSYVTDFSNIFTHVNSLHHQGVIESGSGLRSTTTHKNLSESTQNERIITVQFHPEFMGDSQAKEFFKLVSEWSKKGYKSKTKKQMNTEESFEDKMARLQREAERTRRRARSFPSSTTWSDSVRDDFEHATAEAVAIVGEDIPEDIEENEDE